LVRLGLFGFGFGFFCGSSFGFGVVRLNVDCVFIGFRRFFAVFRCLVSVFRLFIFFRRFIVVVVAAAAVARVTAATTAATFRAKNFILKKTFLFFTQEALSPPYLFLKKISLS
jgi:hypothetical protein